MISSTEPPPVIEVAPVQAAADFVVVARADDSEVVAASDQPLLLRKATRTEDALLRRAVFITTSLTVTRPAGAQAGPDSYRWSYAGFLQRQLCITSMSGDFVCTAAEVTPLPDKAAGEAPLAEGATVDNPESLTSAEAARARLVTRLRANAAGLFDLDRRTKVDPAFKAAGVTVIAR